MEEKKEDGFEIGIEKQTQPLKLQEEEEEVGGDNVLQFLDSVDNHLTLSESLSSTLRQGWLELASARHSMGPSRLNTSLLDLKPHPAATSLLVSQLHEEHPHFSLRKWSSFGHCNDQNTEENELLEKSSIPQLRRRGNFQLSDEEASPKQAPLDVDDQIQRERSRSLSVFGALVSPKLRAAQLSFETALETLVEIANTRSAMLSAFDQVQKGMTAPKR